MEGKTRSYVGAGSVMHNYTAVGGSVCVAE